MQEMITNLAENMTGRDRKNWLFIIIFGIWVCCCQCAVIISVLMGVW